MFMDAEDEFFQRHPNYFGGASEGEICALHKNIYLTKSHTLRLRNIFPDFRLKRLGSTFLMNWDILQILG